MSRYTPTQQNTCSKRTETCLGKRIVACTKDGTNAKVYLIKFRRDWEGDEGVYVFRRQFQDTNKLKEKIADESHAFYSEAQVDTFEAVTSEKMRTLSPLKNIKDSTSSQMEAELLRRQKDKSGSSGSNTNKEDGVAKHQQAEGRSEAPLDAFRAPSFGLGVFLPTYFRDQTSAAAGQPSIKAEVQQGGPQKDGGEVETAANEPSTVKGASFFSKDGNQAPESEPEDKGKGNNKKTPGKAKAKASATTRRRRRRQL